METFNIYQDIAERTGGDIYIGVVGPVRTGKSTFIKRFMDLLVLPHIANTYTRERAKDELPQSASGRTIMTTEPKFVPNEAVEISLGDNADVRVRMIDCAGVSGAGGRGRHGRGQPQNGTYAMGGECDALSRSGGAGDEKGHYRPFHHRDGSDNGRERDRAAAGKL